MSDEGGTRTDLERLTARLYALEFPVLKRPPVPYQARPTAELISWATEVYTFSCIAHFTH